MRKGASYVDFSRPCDLQYRLSLEVDRQGAPTLLGTYLSSLSLFFGSSQAE